MADKYKEICGVEIAVASSQTRTHAAPCNLSIWIKIKVTMAQWHIQRFVVGHAEMDETKKKKQKKGCTTRGPILSPQRCLYLTALLIHLPKTKRYYMTSIMSNVDSTHSVGRFVAMKMALATSATALNPKMRRYEWQYRI